ncbi:hypothetical protein, partial [Streptomyces sp. NRRL S-15]|uniref:hypothetical protein n=1 Tax=Streptomyces sp. NRRL S-15 TaxID=1463886 RepID=UPI001F407BC0
SLHTPSPSGPRHFMAAIIPATAPGSAEEGFAQSTKPAIPHILSALPPDEHRELLEPAKLIPGSR